ncbi:ABC-type transporter, permease component [Desulforapulum autotrophicum HRM2]|uniref:ABC-type transporter, permease component n=1 Tax=Desulforapulum autotrophicum (strain ATCC 43914 / DSM 3382 / VKM B-1955 / HRM2) TaxID=177437 RepID=C0QA84_DESAH|nr:ABC transporter permease [Desulforapulum autotrophicum]ACN14669.1 ABC-type transporter, permease component [Desulforapulum autotrophicum HRM2]
MTEGGSSAMRLAGFLKKETLQILRDPSSLLLGIVMPVVLLFIFGYGVSLDPKNVPVAMVLEDSGPEARELAARFELSPYFKPQMVYSVAQAKKRVDSGAVDGIFILGSDFSAQLAKAFRAEVQLVLNGVDANRTRLIQGYGLGIIGKWLDVRRARGEGGVLPPLIVEQRIWFNESADSTNFLVPGLLTLIMTLTGTLLTALVVAREWEKGTMEALLATPITPGEILLGKIIPYFILGMTGMLLSVILGVFLFNVPLRGSLMLLIALSGLFLLASLGFGLFISSATRVQFVAAMISVIAGFLPAFFLSGLLFDLESTPRLVQMISYLIPARYFVIISQTLFLAGNVWSTLLPAAGMLAVMAIVLIGATRKKLVRRLPQ